MRQSHNRLISTINLSWLWNHILLQTIVVSLVSAVGSASVSLSEGLEFDPSHEAILRLLSFLRDKITNGPDEDCIHHRTNICDWGQIAFTVGRTADKSDESKLCLISTINLSWFKTYFVRDNCQLCQRSGKRVSLIIWSLEFDPHTRQFWHCFPAFLTK